MSSDLSFSASPYFNFCFTGMESHSKRLFLLKFITAVIKCKFESSLIRYFLFVMHDVLLQLDGFNDCNTDIYTVSTVAL